MNGRPWTPEEIETLRQLYPHRPTKEIAALLGRPMGTVYAYADRMGVKKSEEFLASPESGRLHKGETRPGTVATQFKSGHEPANKGLRRPGYSPGRMAETQFKKGHRGGKAAENWHPIGSILPDSDGYLRIKVREAVHGKEPTGFGNVRVWPLLARHVWEQHKGPIPPKHIVIFKDKDRNNCGIENLDCISQADNMRRNSFWRCLPLELAEAIQLNGALKRRIRRKEPDYGREQKKQNQRSKRSLVRDT